MRNNKNNRMLPGERGDFDNDVLDFPKGNEGYAWVSINIYKYVKKDHRVILEFIDCRSAHL